MQVDSSADAAAAAPNPSHATGPLVELSVPLDGAAAWMSPETPSATPNPNACVCRRCIQFLSPVTRMPTTHFSDLSQVAAGTGHYLGSWQALSDVGVSATWVYNGCSSCCEL